MALEANVTKSIYGDHTFTRQCSSVVRTMTNITEKEKNFNHHQRSLRQLSKTISSTEENSLSSAVLVLRLSSMEADSTFPSVSVAHHIQYNYLSQTTDKNISLWKIV